MTPCTDCAIGSRKTVRPGCGDAVPGQSLGDKAHRADVAAVLVHDPTGQLEIEAELADKREQEKSRSSSGRSRSLPCLHAYWRMRLPWIDFPDSLPRVDGVSRPRNPSFGNPSERTGKLTTG